jgi:hypothetical protein
MRKLSLLTAVLLLSCSWTIAKSTANDGSSGSRAQESTLIRGCLSGSTGNFVLTDEPGFDYRLEGHTAGLEKMVGAEVQVRGIQTAAPNDDNSKNGRIDVKRVMKLLDTCSFSEDQKS